MQFFKQSFDNRVEYILGWNFIVRLEWKLHEY